MAPPSTRSVSTDVNDKLEEMSKTIASFSTRFDKLEGLLANTVKENKELKKVISDRDSEINRLSVKLNDLEQYGRSWSIRILDLPIPADEAEDPLRVMQHVYDGVLAPILKGAVQQKALTFLPPVDQILETAHILPSKPNSVPPIICRFYSRNIRALIFRFKRDFAPRHPADRQQQQQQQPGSSKRMVSGKFKHPLFEDLTRTNFHKMRALASHELVQSCWSVSGNLRFKLKNEERIRRVKCVFDPIEKIISE